MTVVSLQPQKNIIPPMTHPLGKYWKQPKASDILIDDNNALMSNSSFEDLPIYSESQPTGVYPGKMWKWLNRGKWWIAWFGYSEKGPDHCSNNYRKIIIA